jgi:hypothetical protein
MAKQTTAVFEEIRRNVAGIDLAWRAENYVCGPRCEDGECDISSFGTTTPELHRMLQWLKERHVESVAMESTSVYWIPATDLLEANGIEMLVRYAWYQVVRAMCRTVNGCRNFTVAGC